MAEILTRTYKYTGKSGWNVGESTVALSSFAVSGDTRPVTQILSISASWYRKHDTSMTVTHTAQLVFGDGSTLKSASVSKRGDGDIFKISAAFSSMPSGALWDDSAVKLRTLLNTKKDKCRCPCHPAYLYPIRRGYGHCRDLQGIEQNGCQTAESR